MDLICFSHLRWNFVYQRPQHLLSRFAKLNRVFYIEEPVFENDEFNHYSITLSDENVQVVVPHLQRDMLDEKSIEIQRALLDQLIKEQNISDYMLWYYTPMSLRISQHLDPSFIVYDCMDELSAFKFAPAVLKELEKELFQKADIVFTGGHNLYVAKKNAHHNIHPFPSSIDKEHFSKARKSKSSPADQSSVSIPRIGFYGVIDERFDLELLATVAERKPEWQFIIIGPVVKIDENSLPRLSNIHYLGSKKYDELPAYLSGWDIAMIPFLLNESTQFISPTKTPEYLAAAKPVISTPITDVINPYAVNEVVYIADNAEDFIEAAEKELSITDKSAWLKKVDDMLAENSWDNTWQKMVDLINTTMKNKTTSLTNLNEEIYV